MGIPSVDPGNLGDILKFAEIISIVGTGIFVVFRTGRFIGQSTERFERATERFELIGEKQAEEITELKKAVQKVADAQTEMAIAQAKFMSEKVRIDNQGAQIAELRKELNQLREGRGFIQPRIEGEYPR